VFAQKRKFEPSVIEQFQEEPYRFEFFQTIRMLETWLKKNGVDHKNAIAEYVRFKNRVSLSFPASELEAVNFDYKSEDIEAEEQLTLDNLLAEGELEQINITPAFMGFLGTNGALPIHYTQRVADQILYERDDSTKAFLDTFTTRAVNLFYEAWKKYRLDLKYDKTQHDEFLSLLLSIAGVGQESLKNRLNDDRVFDESIAYFASAFRHRPVSSEMMERVLCDYFKVPIKVTQFIGGWYNVPENQQTRLSDTGAVLGGGAMVGERVWQRDLCIRLTIGPMKHDVFQDFLPTKAVSHALKQVLTLFTGLAIEYEVELVLAKEDVSGVQIGGEGGGAMLGWNSFVMTEAPEEDRNDVRYRIHTIEQ
jgi:type VI secretion system protein ImpH